jgi:hypothetical protein
MSLLLKTDEIKEACFVLASDKKKIYYSLKNTFCMRFFYI